MARHALVRGGIAALVSMGLAAGAAPFLDRAAAETASEVVIPAANRSTVRDARLLYSARTWEADGAGATGVFHSEEGLDGPQWTRYSDGKTFPVTPAAAAEVTSTAGTGTDAVAYYSTGQVEFRDMATGTAATVTIPDGFSRLRTYGTRVVANQKITAEDGTVSNVLHLLSADGEGGTRDQIITGVPEGGTIGAPVAGDDKTIVFAAKVDGQGRYALVDSATAKVTGYTAPVDVGTYKYALVSPDYLAWHSYVGDSVFVVPRSDLGAQPTKVSMGMYESATQGRLGLVGDWLVRCTSIGNAIQAVPLSGGTPVTLLEHNIGSLSKGPGGTAVVIGGTGVTDWGIRRISEGADGTPEVTTVKTLPPMPAEVEGLALGQGNLVVTDSSAGSRWDYLRSLSVQGTLTYGDRTQLTNVKSPVFECAAGDEGCFALTGLGDGRFVRVVPIDAIYSKVQANGPGQDDLAETTVPVGGKITDANGRYVIYTVAATGKQYVVRVGDSGTVLMRSATAAAVWAGTLWTPGTTAGTVTALDLATKKTTETTDLRSGCVPEELQALGRWLYWSCGGSGGAGVYDRATKTSVTVPSDEAQLGDGYVVTHDKSARKLVLTDVHTGTAVSRTIGDLPDIGRSQHHLRWDVDKFTGYVAYADGSEQVHVVPAGVPAQKLAFLAAEKAATTVYSGKSWNLFYVLSKPVASWKVVIKNKATGATVRTLTGGETRGQLTASWEGRTLEENPLPNGYYTWALTVQPADGQGAALTDGGTVKLTGGVPVWRDFDGDDSFGELFAIDLNGVLRVRKGTGTGTLASSTIGGAVWDKSAKVVPVRDMTGDGCNDLLVRRSSGYLYRYPGTCGKSDIGEGRLSLGSGWSQYDILTSPGDISGDKRADLIARQASTGDIYLYKATSTGKLSSRVKIRSGWTGYKKVVGVGDLNGDGYGDLLAQDKSNELWRYDGTSSSQFKSRVKVFSDWGSSYNAIVGIGDITGDGKADIVSRDTSGNLFRNNGNGMGSFSARTKIATGWQYYKGIF